MDSPSWTQQTDSLLSAPLSFLAIAWNPDIYSAKFVRVDQRCDQIGKLHPISGLLVTWLATDLTLERFNRQITQHSPLHVCTWWSIMIYDDVQEDETQIKINQTSCLKCIYISFIFLKDYISMESWSYHNYLPTKLNERGRNRQGKTKAASFFKMYIYVKSKDF